MKLLVLIAMGLNAAGPGALEASRAHRQQALQSVAAVEQQLGEQQGQLDAVSRRIEELKAQRQQNSTLFVPATLDELLKQSQSLSEALTALRAKEAQVRAEEDAARAELTRSLDERLAADRAALPSAADPAPVVSEIRALEAERASLASPVGPSASPAVRFGSQSDDPRRLHERADALRDRADKLAKEQAQIQARIQELRDQAELDHQLRSFSRDEALFDEGDRRIQVSRTDSAPAAPAAMVASSLPVAAHTPMQPVNTPALNPQKQLPDARNSVTQTNVGGTPTGAFDSSGAMALPTPAAHVDTPAGTGTASPTQVPPATHTGEVVRPDDLASKDAFSPAVLESDSVSDLVAAQAALERQQRELRDQAAAFDAAAQQAR
jgi:hypothetical protein